MRDAWLPELKFTPKTSGEPKLPTWVDCLSKCLELHLEREFKLTRTRSGCFAGDVLRADDIPAGVAWIDVVHGVVGVEPELCLHLLPDVKRLLQRKIGVVKVRSEVSVASGIADLIQARLAEGRVPCLIGIVGPSFAWHIRRDAGLQTGGCIGVAGRGARRIGATVVVDGKRQTGCDVVSSRNLVAADHQILEPVGRVENLFAPAKGQLVAAVSRRGILANIRVTAIHGTGRPSVVATVGVKCGCPLVVDRGRETFPRLLSQRNLQSVEVGVFVVPVIGDALSFGWVLLPSPSLSV
jgi:hypothetical protein